MFLTRLKSCRLDKGYSLRELAGLSGVDHTSIDRLERGRAAQERTVHKLAKALGVEPAALYTVEQTETKSNIESLQTPTTIKPGRSTRAKKQHVPAPALVISWWVFEKGQEISEPLRLDNQPAAERIKALLGQDRARVYAAVSQAEASEQHTQFLIRVARGHEMW